jgi:hypothetical protein
MNRDDCTVPAEDGYVDLMLKFEAQEIFAALGSGSGRQVTVLQLTGNLKED